VAKIKTIGLTGGIACGKSCVTQILTKFGIKVISTDELAHEAIGPRGLAYADVVKEFGSGIVKIDGQIDRKALGKVIFADDQARKRLESIVHPVVIEEMQDQIKHWQAQGLNIVVVEVPLLFEVGLTDLFDQVWVVSASPREQLQRLQARDHLTSEEAGRRISAQLPLADKEAKADVVIINNQGLADLEAQIQRLIKKVE
jgi:dephospho-CoA kinase